MPMMLVRGLAWSVVDDDDVAELLRRQPTCKVVDVEGAGHSIQGDRPWSWPPSCPTSSSRKPGSAAVKQMWWSPRAIGLHAVILVVVPTFAALCLWQLHRALDGNGLSWAYVFEWPFFAGYVIYMWWRFLHEIPRKASDTPPESAATAWASLCAGGARLSVGHGAERELRGEGSNLQHPAPKADVLPIELPRIVAAVPCRGPVPARG